MFEIVEEKKIGFQPVRFLYACMVIVASLAIVLDLRRSGLLMVLRVAAPAAILTIALTWLNKSQSQPSRRLGEHGALALMCIASAALAIWDIFSR